MEEQGAGRESRGGKELEAVNPPTGGGISFTFQKKTSGSRVRREEGKRTDGEAEEKDFVLSLEGREIHR